MDAEPHQLSRHRTETQAHIMGERDTSAVNQPYAVPWIR